MGTNSGFLQRFFVALAAWHNIAQWLEGSEPTTSTITIIGYPFAGLTTHLKDARFDGLTMPPGRLHDMHAFFSRRVYDDDMGMIFGEGQPNLEHYGRILTANAISGWEILNDHPDHFEGATCYIRRFRFGVEPPDFVTVEIVLIYTAAQRGIKPSNRWWQVFHRAVSLLTTLLQRIQNNSLYRRMVDNNTRDLYKYRVYQ